MKNIITATITIIIFTSIKFGNSQKNKCGIEKFQCQSGQCIASQLLCDGRPDCIDQSDETRIECSKPEIMCPDYAFRCAYGGCVDGDATCNGVKDCIDNSDETLARCTNISRNESTKCTQNQYKCDNGQCISNAAICDGTADCVDGSDETFIQCGSIGCSQILFRCTYGACIDGDLKCNGVRNCADGSDEDPRLCRESTSVPTYVPETTSTTSRTPPVVPSWTPKPRPTCTVPLQPQNGFWKLHKSQCSGDEHCNLEQGSQLEQGAYLIYACNTGYSLRGSAHVFCGPTGRWLNIPICIEIRCKSLSSASTDASCTYNNDWVSCESPVLPKTIARLTCRNSYRQDTTLLSTQRAEVICNENGQWEPDPIRCVAVCGRVGPNTTPLVVNGSRPKISEFPWHATIYRSEGPDEPKEFHCGATIVQDNLLITAAHCVFDESLKRVESASNFHVVTGNIFRDYDSPFHDPITVKKASVKNIYVICSYLGAEGNYAWDIAIIELTKPFVFSALLLPACLDTSSYSDQAVLEVGNFGKVAGFGRTALGQSSYILQSLTVPYVPLNQCKSSSAAYETERFITIDKFCAGFTNGSSVCDGDSGGGLVFQSGGLWYLRGIVSVSVGTVEAGASRICDSNTYTLYTRVSSHVGWIQDVILRLETYKTFPPCSSGRT